MKRKAMATPRRKSALKRIIGGLTGFLHRRRQAKIMAELDEHSVFIGGVHFGEQGDE